MSGGMSWDRFREKYGESIEEHMGGSRAGGDAAMVEQRRTEACRRGKHQRPNSAGRCWWCQAPIKIEEAA